jgi:hypothetical protein
MRFRCGLWLLTFGGAAAAQQPKPAPPTPPAAELQRLRKTNDSLSSELAHLNELMAIETSVPSAADRDQPLKGLKSFRVLILPRSTLADSAGLRTQLELRLRQNGITVVDDAREGIAFECTVADADDAAAIYYCSLQVLGVVRRLAPTRLNFVAEMWSTGAVASSARVNLHERLGSTLASLTDSFLNAWYKENPKQPQE